MDKVTNAVGALLEHNGKILILQRKNNNYEGGNWDIPGGRIKSDESPKETIRRELFEETGFIVDETALEHMKTFNWNFKNTPIIFRTFKLKLSKPFEVKLNTKEHTNHKWVTPKECYNLKNLIHGFHELLEEIYLKTK